MMRNYRRGFRRIYGLLAVTYLAVMLMAIPPERAKFWVGASAAPWANDPITSGPNGHPLVQPGGKTLTLDDLDALAAKYGGVPVLSAPPPSRMEKTVWLAEVLTLPPAFGYLSLFIILPWIVRGFSADKPRSSAL